jgi:hypothetical protein
MVTVMKWKAKALPEVADYRIRKKFLWWPRRFSGHYYWLVNAYIVERSEWLNDATRDKVLWKPYTIYEDCNSARELVKRLSRDPFAALELKQAATKLANKESLRLLVKGE